MDLCKIRAKLGRGISLKILLLMLVVFTYMSSAKLPYATSVNMGSFEYVLYCLTDHYYLFYAWLFFMVYEGAATIKERHDLERMRYKTISSFYITELVAKAVNLFFIILLHVVIVLALGLIGLKVTNDYSAVVSDQVYDGNLEVLVAYKEVFKTPLAALGPVVLCWYLGSVFFSSSMYLAHERFGKKGFAASVGILLLSTVLGFMTAMDEGLFEFLFLNNYYILHHVLLNIGMRALITDLSIACLITILLFRSAVGKNRNRAGQTDIYIRLIYAGKTKICVMIFAVLTVILVARTWGDPVSLVWDMTKGFSYRNFDLTELLVYLVPLVSMLFFVNASWEKDRKERNIQAMYRTGSRMKWNQLARKAEDGFILRTILIYTTVYMLAVLNVLSFADIEGSAIFAEAESMYGVSRFAIMSAVILSPVIRAIEYYLILQADRLIYSLSGNTIAAFILSFVLYVPGLLIGNTWPIGKGSAYQLLELGSSSDVRMSVVLVLYVALVVMTDVIIRNKRIIQRKEKVCQQ